jgi:predicted metal-dependent peptidase
LGHFKEIDLPPFADARTYYNLLQQNKDKCKNLQNLLDFLNGGGTAICSHKKWGENKHGEDLEKFGELAKKQIEHIVKEVYESNLKKQAGNLPQYLRDFIINAYKKVEPTIDWKSIIRSFGTSCANTFIKKSRNKPNDRFPDNAAVKIKPKKKLLVALDTSGSIGDKEFNLFIDQVEHIKKTGAEVHIIECDADIGRHYDYTSRDKIGKFTGGGGTCFNPVIDFFKKEKYNGLIYLTDGYCSDSQNTVLNKPVLWVIIPGGTENFKFNGTKISMKK